VQSGAVECGPIYPEISQNASDRSRAEVAAAPVRDGRSVVVGQVDPDFVASGSLALETAAQPTKPSGELPVGHAETSSSLSMITVSPAGASTVKAAGSGSPRSRYESIKAAATL